MFKVIQKRILACFRISGHISVNIIPIQITKPGRGTRRISEISQSGGLAPDSSNFPPPFIFESSLSLEKLLLTERAAPVKAKLRAAEVAVLAKEAAANDAASTH